MLRLRFAPLSMTGDDTPCCHAERSEASHTALLSCTYEEKVNGLDQFDRDKGG